MNSSKQNNKIYVVSAPSGAGKTSLIKACLAQLKNFTLTVSHTTRNPRDGEINNLSYNFVSKTDFEKMISNNEFLEHAKVFNNYYGTSFSEIQRNLSLNKNVILEIDYQGASQVRNTYNEKCISIFIQPPSIDVLKHRLNKRGLDSAETVDLRIKTASLEISHSGEYDYNIINDDFESAVLELLKIFNQEQ